MFELFFAGLQQDFKIFLLAPIICAIFRLAFILTYAPQPSPVGQWRKYFETFRYGFWWGMDFNAYVFLYSLVLVSLPAAFIPAYYEAADTVRLVGVTAYLAVLYLAFMGKMIFYYHFHDTFNQTVRLGFNADKKNFADIFFNQNHGGWIIAGFIAYVALTYTMGGQLLTTVTLPYVQLEPPAMQYALNALVVIGAGTLFYFLRYGGTLNHRKKPEWDDVPILVKDDVFLSKATVDDLIALELALQHPLNTALAHTDEESAAIVRAGLAGAISSSLTDSDASSKTPSIAENAAAAIARSESPLPYLVRRTTGPRIAPPQHIFILFGESHGQAPFDPIYSGLNLMEASNAWRAEEHTIAINSFLPGGMRSRPAITTLMAGIYDADIEINENKAFWYGSIPTSLPLQLKKLGYHTTYFYGGDLNHGCIEHFAPAIGFDEWHGGPAICPPGSPATWLGVHDHIFLESTARYIEENVTGPACHLIYTTSNHGPYDLPFADYGFDVDRVLPDNATVRRDRATLKRYASMWYADQALIKFIHTMREQYPDSLFIVTGDHTTGLMSHEYDSRARSEPTLRELVLTSFAMSHPELTADMIPAQLGCHSSILPTIMELAAPAGTEYLAVAPPLTEPIDHIVTPYCYMTADTICDYSLGLTQQLAASSTMPPYRRAEAFTAERDALTELTAYMYRHSELLDDAGRGTMV